MHELNRKFREDRFCILLREVRTAFGLSLNDAAELAGLTNVRLGEYERGVSFVTLEQFVEFVDKWLQPRRAVTRENQRRFAEKVQAVINDYHAGKEKKP